MDSLYQTLWLKPITFLAGSSVSSLLPTSALLIQRVDSCPPVSFRIPFSQQLSLNEPTEPLRLQFPFLAIKAYVCLSQGPAGSLPWLLQERCLRRVFRVGPRWRAALAAAPMRLRPSAGHSGTRGAARRHVVVVHAQASLDHHVAVEVFVSAVFIWNTKERLSCSVTSWNKVLQPDTASLYEPKFTAHTSWESMLKNHFDSLSWFLLSTRFLLRFWLKHKQLDVWPDQ